MPGYGFKVFVPIDKWLRPSPVITKFVPGHDARILTSVGPGEKETVPIEIHFSDEMKCVDVLKSITFDSKTSDGSVPWIDESSIICHVMTSDEVPEFVAQVATSWTFSAKLMNVSNGVHRLTVTNATTESGLASTNVSSSQSSQILVSNLPFRL
jgi:alpha-1,3-glucan synthase